MTHHPIVSGDKEDIITSYWVTTNKAKQKIKNLAETFAEYCKENPWALECRQYEI